MIKYFIALVLVCSSLLTFAQTKSGSKNEMVMRDTIGNYLSGKRFVIKGFIKNKQTQIHKDDDYLWFRNDGILESAILGTADRADWKWDTTKKVIVVKYSDGKTKDWSISFEKEETKAVNDNESYILKTDPALSVISPASGDAAKFCKSWEIIEHMQGNTKVNYKPVDFIRFHGNGTYEQSSNAKYLRGNWVLSDDGKTVSITINKKPIVWTVTEWKKEKLYMKKDGNETIILKPE
jgi:hypothetical protein